MTQFTGFELAFRTFSLAAATELKISSIFEGSGSVSGTALLFDCILHTNFCKVVKFDVNGKPLTDPYAIKEGVGVRIALKAFGVSSDFAISFAAVAAQTEVDHTSIAYSVETIGVSKEVIKALFQVSLEGTLNIEMYGRLRKAITEVLPAYLQSTTVAPSKYYVPIPLDTELSSRRARGVNFAVACVGQRLSPKLALQAKPADVDAEIVLLTYANYMSGVAADSETKPSKEIAAKANAWLSGI